MCLLRSQEFGFFLLFVQRGQRQPTTAADRLRHLSVKAKIHINQDMLKEVKKRNLWK